LIYRQARCDITVRQCRYGLKNLCHLLTLGNLISTQDIKTRWFGLGLHFERYGIDHLKYICYVSSVSLPLMMVHCCYFSQVLSAFYPRLVLLFCPIINGPACQGDVFVMQL
jgi:hypothetical protein